MRPLLILWIWSSIWLPGGTAFAQEAERIGGHAYEKQATREATLRVMLDRITPEAGQWGSWHLLSPFPYAGHEHSDLTSVLSPEMELDRHSVNGPGPDFTRTYTGKQELEVRWRPIEVAANQRVDLRVHDQQEQNDLAICYLHTTVRSEVERTVTIPAGTDDGVRVWLNGRLLYTKDVPRGLDPNADRLRLELKPGANHVLFKVAQGHGGWDFQIGTRGQLTSVEDAQLRYLLDRDFPPSPERRHYRLVTLPIPEDLVLEVGGLAFYGEDARPVVSTRRGDVYLIGNAYRVPPLDLEFCRFAKGLHEPLGAAVRKDADGEAIYVVQRGELTRLLDQDGDDRADLYETVSDGWGVSGNYHEFAFGPKFDAAGSAWVTLNVGFCGSLGKALVEHRGAALRIGIDGEVTWICDGLRSPNGIGQNQDGEWFYLDNQGDYVATNKLSHLRPGSWHGHPASLRWRKDLEPDSRPPLQPPAVWFPYRKMGQSTADIALDETGGRFGPFEGQLFVGDQLAATVMRVFLEQVNGHYQGACFPFLEGFASGVNRLAFAPDGSLFVGETDRGWGSVGRTRQGVERVVYTGLPPFEILAMRARADGFELEFTHDLDPVTAADPASYAISSYTYEYHPDYGAPEDDARTLEIVAAEVVGSRRVLLRVAPLRAGYVHELTAPGVRSAGNDSLLHPRAYYTLIEIPGRVRPAPTARGRVLLLTQPQDFAGAFSKLEERIGEWLGGRCQLSTSQDLAQLDAGRLSDFDALIFFASGAVSLAASRQADLEAWLREGGALLCAQTDQGGLLDESPWRAPANADAKAWRADYGQGRVFSALLGDRPESWLNGGFQHQLTDALDWCLNGPDLEVAPPPGAVRLFAGGDLSGWRARGGGEPGWRLEDDFMEVTAGSGDLISKREFGDFLLHVEFMTPAAPPEVTGQARGNSGIYLQGRYEVQVLDSFGLDLQLGDCGAIYSKRIPDQNACRPPERWQTYDIRFRAARFDESGAKTENARLSAWHNGLLIHDQVEVDGPTAAALSQDEAARGPIQLQDHGNPVRYRNIWLLEEPD